MNESKDAMLRDSKGNPAGLLLPEISKCRKGAGIIGKTGRLLDTYPTVISHSMYRHKRRIFVLHLNVHPQGPLAMSSDSEQQQMY
jgi:hypothetical protein